MINRLGDVKDQALTMTLAKGQEYADHKEISQRLGADFFFAHLYASWKLGLNEKTNGRKT